jgi:AraC-like DNA-binding protein
VIDAGLTRVRYRGRHHVGGAGAVIAIPPGELHTGEPATPPTPEWGYGWSYRMIYPDAELVRLAAGDRLTNNVADTFFDTPIIVDPEIAAAIGALHIRLLDAGCTLAREEALLTMLGQLLDRYAVRPDAPPIRRADAHDLVRRAREFMADHFARRIRLAEIAERCAVSPFRLIRAFGTSIGIPPHAYLTQLRVSRAQAMLKAGTLVARVAYRCGFADQAHLTRTFRRIIGVTPGAYARAVLGSVRVQ